MKMNIGRVSSGYHFISFMAEANGMSEPPVPHNVSAETAATAPITANTRCPVMSSSIIEENMSTAISS